MRLKKNNCIKLTKMIILADLDEDIDIYLFVEGNLTYKCSSVIYR